MDDRFVIMFACNIDWQLHLCGAAILLITVSIHMDMNPTTNALYTLLIGRKSITELKGEGNHYP